MVTPRTDWLTRLLGSGTVGTQITRPADARPRLWVHLADSDAIDPARRILRRLLSRGHPPLLILSTGPDVDLPDLPPGDPLAEAEPLVTPEAMTRPGWAEDALTRDPPDLGVLIGGHPDLALAAAAAGAGVPLIAAEARFDPPQGVVWPWQRATQRDRILAFSRILLADRLSARVLRRLDIPPGRIEITGPITDVTDPLPCAEAERAAMAQIMAGRPVWAAVEVPEAEIDAVLAAHNEALRLAHRLLLILVPAPDCEPEALAARIRDAGLNVARRDLEEDPEEESHVLLAPDTAEMGLWYRLAPVTVMGGTLVAGAAAGRSPMEAAALGSAVIHGPATDARTEDYRRLDTGQAARRIGGPRDLPDALAELIAPDRAAELAHAAWAVTSGGAAVADLVAGEIAAELAAVVAAREAR